MKSVFTLDGSKLLQAENPVKQGDKASTFERFIDDGMLIVTCQSGAAKCRRAYSKA